MNTKSIVFTEVNKAEVIETELPQLKDYDILLRVDVSTISNGTERANITGDVNVSVAGRSAKATFPRYGGYRQRYCFRSQS